MCLQNARKLVKAFQIIPFLPEKQVKPESEAFGFSDNVVSDN